MSRLVLRDVPITFPFEPYGIQKDYMEKVIECLQTETNGVLESPTGTGKTLSLLCSSLAWLRQKKLEMQTKNITYQPPPDEIFERTPQGNLELGKAFTRLPTIIYTSRTHSQLSQAMQELKRTAYSDMKAAILGSRDQLCINSEVMSETNSLLKNNMCQLKVQGKLCFYYNAVERLKIEMSAMNVVDIEDLVKLGQKKRFCPYYMAKHMKNNADIIFMPYNYLVDARFRKSLGVEIANAVVIIDEAHNIDKVCEESASIQIKSTDITLCIDEITETMKIMSESAQLIDVPKDISAEDLCDLKETMLKFESVFDEIQVTDSTNGLTLEGDYIFELLEKAEINETNCFKIWNNIETIVQILVGTNQNNGVFKKDGRALDLFGNLLQLVYEKKTPEFRSRIKKCFKLHINIEERRTRTGNEDGWSFKVQTGSKKIKVLNYWCFNPGFGMNSLKLHNGVRSIILTSGTLAPLGPLISELDMDVKVKLENPHIVGIDQVCVKIIPKGPDNETLTSVFQNRENPKYIASLGRTICNLVRMIPGGVLIFFPSYPIMLNYQEKWQYSGIWVDIMKHKPILVEPRSKDAFNQSIAEFYAKVNSPEHKGAIFMGVCRGKVSEGLDFIDHNGRAVIITGLPYPPFKDPKVTLKRKYMDNCHASDKEYLNGNDWYNLEAVRAVNQAIGRVIRHRNDYGAILLLDSRFQDFRIKSRLSMWLRNRIQVVSNFGEIMRDLRVFFKNSEDRLPAPQIKSKSSADTTQSIDLPPLKGNFDFSTSSSMSSLSSESDSSGLVTLHRRRNTDQRADSAKRKRTVVVQRPTVDTKEVSLQPTMEDTKEYIAMVKSVLPAKESKLFFKALNDYKETLDVQEFCKNLDKVFAKQTHNRFILKGLNRYIKKNHEQEFEDYCCKML